MTAPNDALPELGRIGLSGEQADLLDIAERFCAERSPISRVRALMGEADGFDLSTWEEMAALGWHGVAIPENDGGTGLTLAEATPIVEQMGRRLMSSPFVSSQLAAQIIMATQDPVARQTLLARIAAGAIAAPALYERLDSWSLADVRTEFLDAPDHQVVIRGEKILVEYAPAADFLVVSGRHRGVLALACVRRAAISPDAFRRETLVDETRRSFRVRFDDVRIPASDVLSGNAERALSRFHLAANLLLAAEMCGGALATIEVTTDYLRTRKQFGRLIGSYQALKHPLVEAYVRYEQARSHLYAAAHCFDEPGVAEIAVRMAKSEAERMFAFVSDRAIQFHGGYGFTYDCDAQLYRRRSILGAALHGDADYHRALLADLLF
jgi:alkylation response protein AidB-like acyl-CoA dehydrogenase